MIPKSIWQSREFRILTTLVKSPKRVFSREELMDIAWDDEPRHESTLRLYQSITATRYVVVRNTRTVKVHLSSAYPHQELFASIYHALEAS